MVFGFDLLRRNKAAASSEEKEPSPSHGGGRSGGGDDDRYTNQSGTYDSDNDSRREDADDEKGEGSDYDISATHRITSAEIVASNPEKESILRRFGELRNENTFCDVNFLCKGVLFRGHRVIISSWSRWLRSLLVESPNEEVISLDIFASDSLGAVLEYMYGVPLYINVARADGLLCVVRRLELVDLEQQIWKFLMSAIDADNCDIMHELADRYDCPALKLAAFKALKEKEPAYAAAPDRHIHNRHRHHHDDRASNAPSTKKFYDNGLIGPGERNKTQFDDDEDGEYGVDDNGDDIPSILKYRRGSVRAGAGRHEFEQAYYQYDDDDESQATIYHPRDLPNHAPASEVVEAWAQRLRQVYQECIPKNLTNDDDTTSDAGEHNRLDQTISKVRDNLRLHYTPRAEVLSNSLNRSKLSDSVANSYSHFNSSGVEIPRGSNMIDWHKELKSFYLDLNMPDKIATLPDILRTWRGKEEQMVSSLIIKYKQSISKQMMAHLKSLIIMAETGTESSFVNTAQESGYYGGYGDE